jgi:hypothetical protein
MQFFLIPGAPPLLRRTVELSHGGLSGHKSKMKFLSDYHRQAESMPKVLPSSKT